jgi:NitT/TauT family transport system permease protein
MRPRNGIAGQTPRWVSLAVVAAALALWEWLVYVGRIPALFFPSPSVIAGTLIRLIRNGELARHLKATLSRVFLGLLVGATAGYILGLVMGWSRPVRTLLDPFISALHPLPKIALLPLFMIVFGLGESTKVVAVAVSAFFPMLVNTVAGASQIHPVYLEVAQNYGASVRRVFTRVIMPATLPWVLTGLRLALNTALLVTIAVELVTAKEGLGQMIWFAWQTLRTEELYTALVVIGLLGTSFNRVLEWLVHILIPWESEGGAQ